MSSSGTNALQAQLSGLFNTIGTQLLGDASGVSKGLLLSFFQNVQKNPTVQNVVAQGALLQASFLLSGPTLEQEAIAQIAADGAALVAKLP